MNNLYVYHATDAKNKDSIMKKGLIINPPHHNWDGFYCENQIFLAFSADAAISYVEGQEEVPEEIILFKIKLTDIDDREAYYDWNNRCEYSYDINSFVYLKDIPADKLKICDYEKEPDQDIKDFEDTFLYDRIMTVFEEQVETNKENFER